MIITISGFPGSGKSTVAQMVADKLGYRHVGVGDIMRDMAQQRGMTILQISKLAESDKTVDLELDTRQKQLAKESKLVVDSRLGFHFIPKSYKVFLDVSLEEAGKRIYNAKRHSEKENLTLEDTITNTKLRRASEILRYKKYYKLEPFKPENFDLVLDTTKLMPAQVAEKIIKKFSEISAAHK